MRIEREQEMEASFEVIAEPEKDMIRLIMSGFFAEPDIRRMRAALMKALTELHCAPNQHKTLCDIREMKIQSQESVTLFQQLVGSEPIRSRLLAFVTSATLARLQARRLTSREGVRFSRICKRQENGWKARDGSLFGKTEKPRHPDGRYGMIVI